jgi:tetratricopeptide (TPR) repeat protein
MPAASSLLRRASSLLPVTDPGRPKLLLEAGEALIEVGELAMADTLLQASAEGLGALSDLGLQTAAELARLNLRYATAPEETEREVIEEVERVVPILEELSHHEGLARAWRLVTLVHWTGCRYAQAEEAALRMIEHARLAGDDLMVKRVLPALAICAQYGPTPVTEAAARCEALLEEVGGDRKARALILGALAHLEAMRGNFDRGRTLYQESRSGLAELGWNLQAALTSLVSGAVEMLAGDPAAAERELRDDYEALDRMGEKNYISTTAALLSEALYQQGRFDEATEFAAISEKLAAPDDVSSQYLWRCVAGKVLARRERFDESEALVRRGLELIRATDEIDSQATALIDLAEVLVLRDRTEEAAALVMEAQELFDTKGNVVSAGRARGLAEALAGGTTPVALDRPFNL